MNSKISHLQEIKKKYLLLLNKNREIYKSELENELNSVKIPYHNHNNGDYYEVTLHNIPKNFNIITFDYYKGVYYHRYFNYEFIPNDKLKFLFDELDITYTNFKRYANFD